MDDLNECTFSPVFISKDLSQHYLRKRSQHKSPLNYSSKPYRKYSEIQRSTAPYPLKKELTSSEYEAGKRKIVQRLHTQH
jgi:hypothetical protein